jgi:hypothetical protein
MSLGLRLSLLPLLIAGCAAQRLEVPDSDWETVPAPTRATVDRQAAADLAAAQAELTAATAGLAELQRSLPRADAPPAAAPQAAPAPLPGSAPSPATPHDEWATTLQHQERARRDAFVRVEAAKTAWQRADLSWRELRLAAAKERIAMVVCQRELVRAQTIDRNLPGTETYNVAPLRGQFSQAQQRWYTAANSARQARGTLEHASAQLASSKEAYAQLMRNVPLSTSIAVTASDDRPPPLQLTGWAVTRADIRRRRGLRHFLDEVASAPAQLRKVALRLSVRAVPATPTGPAATTGAPAAEVRGNAPAPAAPTGMHPADAAAAGLSTSPGSQDTAAKPAGQPGSPSTPASRSANNGKPAPASPFATSGSALSKPASPSSSGVPAGSKPAPGASQANPPATAADPVTKPASPASPATPLPTNNKPAASTVQASPPIAAGTTAARSNTSTTTPAPVAKSVD